MSRTKREIPFGAGFVRGSGKWMVVGAKAPEIKPRYQIEEHRMDGQEKWDRARNRSEKRAARQLTKRQLRSSKTSADSQ